MAIYPAKGELDRISSAGRVRGNEEANFGSANGRCGCCQPYCLLHHLLRVWHCCSFHGYLRADRPNLGRDHGSRGTADDFHHHFFRVCRNRDFVDELPLLEDDICRPILPRLEAIDLEHMVHYRESLGPTPITHHR